MWKDVPMRVFEIEGKTIPFTAFAFKLKGNFPHCYLDRIDNKHGETKMLIPLATLPSEFSKFYKLHVPRKYEMEALQIFTTDILSYFLENDIPYDIEFYDNEMIVIYKSYFDTVNEFKVELEKVGKLMSRMRTNLDRIDFDKIGNLPPLLAKVEIDQYKKSHRIKMFIWKIVTLDFIFGRLLKKANLFLFDFLPHLIILLLLLFGILIILPSILDALEFITN